MGSAVIAHFIQYKLLQSEFLEHSELFQINILVQYILFYTGFSLRMYHSVLRYWFTMYYSRLRLFVKDDVILNFVLYVWQAGVTPFQRRQSLCYVYS
jgi:hypothetical protein